MMNDSLSYVLFSMSTLLFGVSVMHRTGPVRLTIRILRHFVATWLWLKIVFVVVWRTRNRYSECLETVKREL